MPQQNQQAEDRSGSFASFCVQRPDVRSAPLADMARVFLDVRDVPKAEIGMIVLKRSGAKRQATALSAVISCLPDGKLNSTVHAFFCERECDRAAEFVRDEIAYEVGAVARWMLTGHRGAAKLAPVQG